MAALVACLAFAGCSDDAFMSNPTLHTRYEPLHPRNEESVTFEVTAADADAQGIETVRLFLHEYELSKGELGFPIGALRKDWGEVAKWPGPWGQGETFTGEYVHEEGFPANTLVYYYVMLSGDDSERTEQWLFAAGDWPFDDMPIPLLANGPPGRRANICFVADAAYGVDDPTSPPPDDPARAMLTDLAPLIFDGFHASNALDGKYRRLWQFSYWPKVGEVHSVGAPSGIPKPLEDSPVKDYVGVVHTKESYTDYFLVDYFTTHGKSKSIAVHEASHLVFGLADEYADGAAKHWWVEPDEMPHHNIFEDPVQATEYNEKQKKKHPNDPAWKVVEPDVIIEATDGKKWWAAEPNEPACIMRERETADGTMHDFQRTCINRARWYYKKRDPVGPPRGFRLRQRDE